MSVTEKNGESVIVANTDVPPVSLSQPSPTDAPVITRPKCAICGTDLRVSWTDTHGVAACLECGLPYRLYHYENDARVEKPPTVAIKDEWVVVGRQYWQETHRRTFPAAYDMGILRGERSYSGATREDCELFDAWLDAHPELVAQAKGGES